MSIEIDSSISILTIIAGAFFCISLFYNIGYLIQIQGSNFLEEYDDKAKIIKKYKEKLFDFKTDIVKKFFSLLPYMMSILFCYAITPFLIEISEEYCPKVIPDEYNVSLFVFTFGYLVFLVGEAFWGINERYLERKDNRIFYNRPIWRVLIIFGIFWCSGIIDNSLSIDKKSSIMQFFQVNNIEEYRFIFIFIFVVLVNNIFLAKIISRYIVMIDNEIYVENLKIKEDKYYSFYGMANLVLSLVLLFGSIILLIKYYAWKNISLLSILVMVFMMVEISVLAGQRECFVYMTRKKIRKKDKLYYVDINGKNRLLKD